MEQEEKIISEKRKQNIKLYTMHRMLTADLLFYYAIKFAFLTQIKGLSAGDIVLASAFFGVFKLLSQIPTIILIDRIGSKKSLILSDLLMSISVLIVMLSNNLATLIFANLISGMSSAIKEVAENGLLNKSIPDMENKSSVFAKIDSKGLGNFYYMSAISAVISGLLFEVNGYIPMSICIVTLLIAARIATMMCNVEEEKNRYTIKSEIAKEYKNYFKDIKLAFSFIFHSRRLKALMVYAGVMYGIIMVMNTYEMGLLQEIELSSTAIGIIYAAMQIVSGIAASLQSKLHEKLRNKTLTVIGISYTIACLVAGLIAISKAQYAIIILVIVITYVIRYLSSGSYYILIKKYITNFTNEEVSNKVYSAYGIVTGFGNALIGMLGSIIVSHYNLKISMIIFGLAFTLVMCVVLQFMKTRVGLKPEEYRKKDINYKEYISLK